MLYEASNPAEYMEALASDWRKEKLQELRNIILTQDSKIQETINYKMLCFKLNVTALFHLNAQKAYVSLYCDDTKTIDPDGTLLTGLNLGKGCIRFTKTKDIAKTGIEDFIKRVVVFHKKGNE